MPKERNSNERGKEGPEMTHQFRSLAAPPEDLGLIPSTRMMVLTAHNASPMEPNTLFWPL